MELALRPSLYLALGLCSGRDLGQGNYFLLFALRTLCSSTGSTVHVEPYCGKSTRLADAGLGHGPNIVLGLVEHAEVQEGSLLNFDNLFLSIPLLIKFSERGLGGYRDNQ